MEPRVSRSLFSSLQLMPYDEAFRVKSSYEADEHPDKVNLGLGVYRDDSDKPWTLPSVREAILNLPDNHDYISAGGLPRFVASAQKLLFGSMLEEIQDRLTGVQTVSGSGACHIGAVFLNNAVKPGSIWISNPSWINHPQIWELAAPHVERKFYPYFDEKTKSVDFVGMISALEEGAIQGDVVLLQACAHNPTGCDPTKEQWREIADLCERKGLIPFFDTAYQGFASGNADEDAWSLRHFAKRGTMEILVAQSFSKNFGLYGQRVGALHLLVHDVSVIPAIKSNLIRLIRAEYGSPPSWGCRVVDTVLNSPSLKDQWHRDLETMTTRIRSVRHGLYDEIQKRRTPGSWEHIVNHIGMFSYTGLRPEEVERLKTDYHIHMFSTGRASVSGLNSRNIPRVAEAIDRIIRENRAKS